MTNSNEYLYTKVKQQIMDFVKDLPINSKIPTRTELVKKFGVTRTTVDRAISELIGEGYFYSKVGSGTYFIDKNKSRKEEQPNRSLGIIIPSITNDTYPEIIRAVEDVCSKSDINLIICNTDNSIEKERKYINNLIDSKVSGILIVPATERIFGFRREFEVIKENNISLVFCNRGLEGINAPKVVSNDYYGGIIATRHLLQNGWKSPAYISKPFYTISEQRYNGYLSALYEQMINPNEDFVIFEESFNIKQTGYEAMKSLLRIPNSPDSVFCFNDAIAIGVYKAIEEAGKKVGKDIGVVGYDDSRICDTLSPKLTSVRFPKYEIGKRAAEILLGIINNENELQHNSVIMQPKLVVRASSGKVTK